MSHAFRFSAGRCVSTERSERRSWHREKVVILTQKLLWSDTVVAGGVDTQNESDTLCKLCALW